MAPENATSRPSGYAENIDIRADASIPSFSAEEILNYVRNQLTSIDGEMEEYRKDVEIRKLKSDQLREAQAILREMKDVGDGQIGAYDEAKYNRMMTLFAQNLDNKLVAETYERFLHSYGGYHVSEDITIPQHGSTPAVQVREGEVIGVMAGWSDQDRYLKNENGKEILDENGLPTQDPNWVNDDQNMDLNKNETQTALENIKDALTTINEENEMVMMDLQALMMKRNRVVEFASMALKKHDEVHSTPIRNI